MPNLRNRQIAADLVSQAVGGVHDDVEWFRRRRYVGCTTASESVLRVSGNSRAYEGVGANGLVLIPTALPLVHDGQPPHVII